MSANGRIQIWSPKSIFVERQSFEGGAACKLTFSQDKVWAEIVLTEGQISDLKRKLQEIIDTI